MSVFEGNELRTANACDWLNASVTPLRKQFSIAIGTIGLVVFGGKSLSSQGGVAIGATEAFPVPRLILVSNATRGYHFFAFTTTRGELFFVALRAIHFFVLGDEAFRANGRFA
jgi:hypothetical protein